MRLKGRQARFLTILLCLWAFARGIERWPVGGAPAIAEATRTAPIDTDEGPAAGIVLPVSVELAPDLPAIPTGRSGMGRPSRPHRDSGEPPEPPVPLRLAYTASSAANPPAGPPADAVPAAADLLRPPAPAGARPWTLDGYLFVRPGSGRAALSPAGQLGGSQFAARATYRVADIGPIAIAAVARIYAPLESRGAEAAAGVDVRLNGAVPVRLSVERRQRIDRAGRSAWSAYVAGGIYCQTRGLVFDGYGQAGMVGLRRHDLFVDGALRAGTRLGGRAIVGGALWGAAQPGVARLDIGPRAAWRLPIADHGLSLAIEGRFRIAGRARPGDGVAITLAAYL